MKWLKTMLLFNCGEVAQTADWKRVHESLVRAITGIDFPRGSGTLTLRRKTRIEKSSQWRRNGVGYLRTRFLQGMVEVEGWQQEAQVGIEHLQLQPELLLYPGFSPHKENITSGFGDFDFMTETPSGLHIAIEWETGNISSSHRSVNKLTIALAAGRIQAGVLILPSRALYEHLTDRIGNIGELSPYLTMWSQLSPMVKKGVLAITVVEQDALTDDKIFPYLTTGNDGRAKQGRQRLLTSLNNK